MMMHPLNLLFIIDPLETLHLDTDTTFVIMAEAYRRKHRVWIAYLDDLHIKNGVPYSNVRKIQTHVGKEKKWKILDMREYPLEHFPVIFMRKDPPITIDYLMATYLLSLVNRKKTIVINNPEALRNFNEKLSIFQFPEFIPKTIVSKKCRDIIAFLKNHKKIVIKPLEGFAGREVFVLDTQDTNRNPLLEMVTHNERRYIMTQEYLPAVVKGDKRILLLNGKILGQQLRIAAQDDHRSNISAGGTSHKTNLTRHERSVAEKIGNALRKQGIYFVGIDMIGEYLTEINITCPTGIVKINEHDGTQLERKVVDFLEEMAYKK